MPTVAQIAGYYLAANAVPVGVNFAPPATFPQSGPAAYPYNKLSVFVNNTDVVVQLLLDPTGAFADDVSQEILLRMGFNSREPLPPFYQVRFKVWESTQLPQSGTVDMSMYQIPSYM